MFGYRLTYRFAGYHAFAELAVEDPCSNEIAWLRSASNLLTAA
jgi:hypothetical protein